MEGELKPLASTGSLVYCFNARIWATFASFRRVERVLVGFNHQLVFSWTDILCLYQRDKPSSK